MAATAITMSTTVQMMALGLASREISTRSPLNAKKTGAKNESVTVSRTWRTAPTW